LTSNVPGLSRTRQIISNVYVCVCVCVCARARAIFGAVQPASNIDASFTICFWLKKTSAMATGTILLQCPDDSDEMRMNFSITTSTAPRKRHWDPVGTDSFVFKYAEGDSGIGFEVDDPYRTAWTFWCLSGEDGLRTVYRSQSATLQVHQDSPALSYLGRGDLRIGYGSLESLGMEIDDLMIFHRALPSGDVEDVKNGGALDRSALVLLFRFHHQQAWERSEYGQHSHQFAVSAGDVTDAPQLVGTAWRLTSTRSSGYFVNTGLYQEGGGYGRWGGVSILGCLCNMVRACLV
jgi:hypothetical protein